MPLMFRSSTDKPVRVALLTGHVAVIGPEERELEPRFHAGALAAGCITNEMQTLPGKDELAEPKPDASDDDLIRGALEAMLEGNEPGHFTASGHPDLRAVRKLGGKNFSKDAILSVWSAMNDA